MIVALVLLAFTPWADEAHAVVTLAVVAGLMVALVAYEVARFGDTREMVRHDSPA